MDESRLRERVDAPVTHLDSTPSTNDRARRLGHEGAPHGAVVVADEQTASRGRNGSAWAAPAGGVWLSVVLRPDVSAAHVGRLTFAAGVAVAETVEQFGVDTDIKWPNDVLVSEAKEGKSGAESDGVLVSEAKEGKSGAESDGVLVSEAKEGKSGHLSDDGPAGGTSGAGKLAGVLTEAVVDDIPVAGKPVDEVLPGTDPANADLSFVVLGVGLNADLDPARIDADREVATMREVVGSVDPTEVAAALHDRLLDRASDVETAAGFASVLDAWRERSRTLGERVRVDRRAGESVEGVAVRVTETGALVVETASGEVAVTEGECRRLRSTQ